MNLPKLSHGRTPRDRAQPLQILVLLCSLGRLAREVDRDDRGQPPLGWGMGPRLWGDWGLSLKCSKPPHTNRTAKVKHG